MEETYYSISELSISTPSHFQFHLHSHEEYEIFLFMKGDAKYIVEEQTYTLEPYDIILIKKQAHHRIYHNSDAHYERCVLLVSPEFFQKNNCLDYETPFLQSCTATNHKINAEIVRSSGLYDAFARYKKYSENYFTEKSDPVLTAIIIEILYLINKITNTSTADIIREPIKSVLLYLDSKYVNDITLDMLAEHFYLSKYYLCRAFHKATGITIHEYICRKRLTLVKELKSQGNCISEAAMMAGFCDYSSFYRAYLKEYGVSPRNDMN